MKVFKYQYTNNFSGVSVEFYVVSLQDIHSSLVERAEFDKLSALRDGLRVLQVRGMRFYFAANNFDQLAGVVALTNDDVDPVLCMWVPFARAARPTHLVHDVAVFYPEIVVAQKKEGDTKTVKIRAIKKLDACVLPKIFVGTEFFDMLQKNLNPGAPLQINTLPSYATNPFKFQHLNFAEDPNPEAVQNLEFCDILLGIRPIHPNILITPATCVYAHNAYKNKGALVYMGLPGGYLPICFVPSDLVTQGIVTLVKHNAANVYCNRFLHIDEIPEELHNPTIRRVVYQIGFATMRARVLEWQRGIENAENNGTVVADGDDPVVTTVLSDDGGSPGPGCTGIMCVGLWGGEL